MLEQAIFADPETLPDQHPAGLDEALRSRAFGKAPVLKKLLTYLWEHREDSISEYAIAVEALGRKKDFDPRHDAAVRVLMSRLRQRLKEFYETEGVASAFRIVIPVGSHQLQVIQLETEPALPVVEAVASVAVMPRRNHLRTILWAQAAVILLLVITNLWTYRKTQQVKTTSQTLPVFWQQFLGNGKLTRIVVPKPVFFGWGNGLMARDISVNDYSRIADSAFLRELKTRFGEPSLALSYVGSPDVFAVNRLSPYLDPTGDHIPISTTGEVSTSELNDDNLILIGTPNTLAPVSNFVDELSFGLDVNHQSVFDRRSQPGTPAQFLTVKQSDSRITTPGIIACLPGSSAGTHVLVLMTTNYTSALVAYLTSARGMAELHRAQMEHGNPPYFEAIINSDIVGSTSVKERLVEFRPYTARTGPASL